MALVSASAHAQCVREVGQFVAADASAGQEFGYSVSIDGDFAAIGASGDGTSGPYSGALYVFQRNVAAWSQTAKLLPEDPTPESEFGRTVAVDGDLIAVSAWLDDDQGAGSGSAYVFRFDGSAWRQEAKLLPRDGFAYDLFGWAVDVSDNRVIVGAEANDDRGVNSGCAYVFTYDGATWQQEAKLLPADGQAFDYFGHAAALDGTRALVGAWLEDDKGSNSGCAYVFALDGARWIQTHRLDAPDGVEGDDFGRSVDVRGDRIIIGAIGDDDLGENSGSAYIYEWDGATWTLAAKLTAPDGAAFDNFGEDVSMDGDRAAVSAVFADGAGVDSGKVYFFEKDATGWRCTATLESARAAPFDDFGCAVALNGDDLLVGTYGTDGAGPYSGSAVIFDVDAPCAPVLTGDAACPAGGPILVEWSGATPNGPAALLFAFSEGAFVVPSGNPCAGVVLGLGAGGLQVAFQGASDRDGARSLSANAPAAACGGYLQLLDIATCAVSNTASVE